MPNRSCSRPEPRAPRLEPLDFLYGALEAVRAEQDEAQFDHIGRIGDGVVHAALNRSKNGAILPFLAKGDDGRG